MTATHARRSAGRRQRPALFWLLYLADAGLMIASGLACCVGYKTRPSAIAFASTLAVVAEIERVGSSGFALL